MAKLCLACPKLAPAMKIDEAPPVSTPTGAELLPCSASGAAKRLTAQQIATRLCDMLQPTAGRQPTFDSRQPDDNRQPTTL